jgi:Holliday junction DNA helicase RuvA
MALSILSGMSTDTFEGAIAANDAAGLTRIPGVGRKTAERLVVEMRDHFRAGTHSKPASGAMPTPREEALNALLALGYKPAEASRLLELAGETADTTEGLLRAALQGAAR